MYKSSARSPLTWFVHITVALLVILWTLPTAGLFITAIRDKDQIVASGWWTALSTSTQNVIYRAPAAEGQLEQDGAFVISGNVLEGGKGFVSAFGTSSRDPAAYEPGQAVDAGDGAKLTVEENGDFRIESAVRFENTRGMRIFYTAEIPPRFTLDNYRTVLTAEGIGQSFLNSLTVAIPSTIIPILVAAFAAYALAWMKFPGRALLLALIVGLLVVPLQMSLIPLLRLYSSQGLVGTYPGIWLAHTGFGLPLAIFLLRSYIGGLPRELIESANIDGASHFQIFIQLIVPLSIPALASFAIFQFLWVWNDMLVALVFLGQDRPVLTVSLAALTGSRGENWEILTAAAFVSIIVPLIVFFSLQRYFVRGLLAGSIKGG